MQQLTLDQTTFGEAEAWANDNPEAYVQIVEWAHEDADIRGYCSMQAYLEALRSPAIARRLGLARSDAVYTVNHNLRAALTRLVLSEHPHLPFHPRKSKTDPQGVHATPTVR